MPKCEVVEPRWPGTIIVAATGPSLTPEVAEQCRGYPTIAISDAYKLMPWADVLYSCDAAWWKYHKGCPDFQGEKWSCHGDTVHNNKKPSAEQYGLRLVRGEKGDIFSLDPSLIRYGGNSGFQATGLALHFAYRPSRV